MKKIVLFLIAITSFMQACSQKTYKDYIEKEQCKKNISHL